jgi:hypothetical protein
VKKDFPLDRAIMIAALLNSVQIGDEPQGSVFGHTVFADKLAEPDQLAVDPPVPRPDSPRRAEASSRGPAPPWTDGQAGCAGRSACPRKQRAELGLEPGVWVLAAQDRQLVAEDQNLDLFGIRRPPAEHHQLLSSGSMRNPTTQLHSTGGTTSCSRLQVQTRP